MNAVVSVVSSDQERTKVVSSMFTVSGDPMCMILLPARDESGDFAPRSAARACASTLKESLGAPCTAFTGTSTRVARTTSMLSCRNAGIATRNRLRAEGTPPTARLESLGGVGGVKTKLSKRLASARSVCTTLSGVAETVSGIV